jgi:hydrogenase maturation factor
MFSSGSKACRGHYHPDQKGRVHLKFMHVCGTHQDTLVKHGWMCCSNKQVLKIGRVLDVLSVSRHPEKSEILVAKEGKTIATFGDMIRALGLRPHFNRSRQMGAMFEPMHGY